MMKRDRCDCSAPAISACFLPGSPSLAVIFPVCSVCSLLRLCSLLSSLGQHVVFYSLQLSTSQRRQFYIQRNMHKKEDCPTDLLVGWADGGKDIGSFSLKAGASRPPCISSSWGELLGQWPQSPRRPFTLGSWCDAHFLWLNQFSIHDQSQH